MTAKAGNVLCANDTDMCTSPSAPYLRCQPGITAGQKARFLERCAFSVLHPSPREVRRDLGTSHPVILNHGLTNNKYMLEKCKKNY